MQKLFFNFICFLTLLLSSFFRVHFYNDKDVVAHYNLNNPSITCLYNSLSNLPNIGVQNKAYYAPYYFNNLRNNFAYNYQNSCTFVSLGMLLSYYDTYWDDRFIPETYETSANYSPCSSHENLNDLIPLNAESPGVVNVTNSYYNIYSNYLNNLESLALTYFQEKLITLAIEYLNLTFLPNNYFELTLSQLYSFLNYYLYSFIGFSTSEVEIFGQGLGSNNVDNSYDYYVKHGIPVLSRRTINVDEIVGHDLIIYDYARINYNDYYYAHPGWKDFIGGTTVTHVSLTDLPFNYQKGYLVIVPKIAHSHTNNYSNGMITTCSCNFMLPRNIEIENECFIDRPANFVWDSCYKERWVANCKFKFNIFTDSLGIADFSFEYINNNYCLFKSKQRINLIFGTNGLTYFARVYIYSTNDVNFGNDYYYESNLFNKPTKYEVRPYIEANDYNNFNGLETTGFEENFYCSQNTTNLFSFQTARKRAGYYNNEYIVLSAIKSGISEAYVEYKFANPLTRVDVVLCHYGNVQDEILNNSNGRFELQVFLDNSWLTHTNLLSTQIDLPRNRETPNIYNFQFETPVSKIRFYSSYNNQATNTDDKGRVCIGDIAFYEASWYLPTSSYEIECEPELWNSDVSNIRNVNNCYNYAINYMGDSFLQPGFTIGITSMNSIDFNNHELFKNLIITDFANLNLSIREISKFEICDPGKYKICLVISPIYENLKDYHFYRQNPDGTRSHKPGPSNVINYDTSEEIIYDPSTCDRSREQDSEFGYEYVLGFYEISPATLIQGV